MKKTSFLKKIKEFLREHFFNLKWRCVVCNKEIFSGDFFCEECKEALPLIDKYYCDKCGRKLKAPSEYCASCKGKMTFVDKARSIYDYQKPINKLIMQFKYFDKRYVADVFGDELANLYRKSYFNADFLCYIPMTERAEKKRGYNQGELLAKVLSEKINVPINQVLEKVKDTPRQAKLSRENRLKNLKGSFKREIEGKTIVIIDDVFTTGATSETVAEILKRKGAKAVYLLTVASVTSKEGY